LWTATIWKTAHLLSPLLLVSVALLPTPRTATQNLVCVVEYSNRKSASSALSEVGFVEDFLTFEDQKEIENCEESNKGASLVTAPELVTGGPPPINAERSAPIVENPDFSFFGVFDGHNGHYVSEALQKALFPLFQKSVVASLTKLQTKEAEGGKQSLQVEVETTATSISYPSCIREACAQIDRAILGRDLERQRILKLDRSDSGSIDRRGSNIKETLSFAGKSLSKLWC